MNKIKFNYSLLILGIVLICFSACSTLKYTSPDAPEWAVGVLKTDDPASVRIASVDGKKATGTLKGHPVNEFPDSVILLPGFHTIVPCFIDANGVLYGDSLSFYSQEKNEYTLWHKIKWDKTIKFRIECKGVDITTDN